MTFDSWDVGIYPETYLAHHGIKGMKHGRNRYQTESGEWTEEGLERRRKREGFGEEPKKENSQKAKTEKQEARKKAIADATAAYAEKFRKKNIKNLSDKELRAKIERVKMEQEYKDLTRSPLLKAGENFITNYFKNKNEKAERKYKEGQLKLEREHELTKLDKELKKAELNAETEQAKAEADKARAGADRAKAEADRERANTDRIDIESGTRLVSLKNQRRSDKLAAKKFRSENTITGGIRRMINKSLSGRGEGMAEAYKGYGQSWANYTKDKMEAKGAVKQNKIITRRNRKLKPGEQKVKLKP